MTRLLEIAPVAVVKRGRKGATILARDGPTRKLRFEVATTSSRPTDTTGAGDAFDAGFLVGWLAARSSGPSAARDPPPGRPPRPPERLPATSQPRASELASSASCQPERDPPPMISHRPARHRARGRHGARGRPARGRPRVDAHQPRLALSPELRSPRRPRRRSARPGAVPATVAIRDGSLLVGLDERRLEALATAPAGSVRKAAAARAWRWRWPRAAGPRPRSRRR